MKRLIKKSNHVEPSIHNEVEDKIIHPNTNINENQNPSFLLTRQLFADTAFTPTATISYQFARKIENGEFSHLGSIEEARGNWSEWLNALDSFLEESGHKGLKKN
ncbi:gp17 [Bacillus phage G]|uniref:Gp17 n=1 Tax=Bacillus phage G TaxID=2884420 RepID=G3MB87_9CAUD|nr:gp17 [Bacillus phage G]AEO93288.1 gp17 [Bacillus phage G]